MLPNQIPSAIHLFNKETVEKNTYCREILGLKKFNNSFGGLYGIDFVCEDAPVDKNNYIKCLENGCSFRGPESMMEFHVTSVHESGLNIQFDTDTKIWIDDRKKNFPKSSLARSQPEKFVKQFDKKNLKRKQKNQKKFEQKKEISEPINFDPLLAILGNKSQPVDKDLLGLGALYGSSDEDELIEQNQTINYFSGLPTLSDLPPELLVKRRNKFKFPILPQMDLQSKRNALMNPQRRYHETFNRKVKRPRLSDLLLADEILTEKSRTLQNLRYTLNKRFFDPSLQCITLMDVRQEPDNDDNDEKVEEEFFTNCDDAEIENNDSIEWSDDDD